MCPSIKGQRLDDLQPFQFAEKLLSKAVSMKLNVVTPTIRTVKLALQSAKKMQKQTLSFQENDEKNIKLTRWIKNVREDKRGLEKDNHPQVLQGENIHVISDLKNAALA